MRASRKYRVLMLGWEYPPRFAGGLGKACQGLSQAMAKQEVQVYFVLPSFPERVSQKHLEVVGAVECLIEAGWGYNGDHQMPLSSISMGLGREDRKKGVSTEAANGNPNIQKIKADARMFPYGVHPSGPISEDFKKVLDRMSLEQPSQNGSQGGLGDDFQREGRPRISKSANQPSGRAAGQTHGHANGSANEPETTIPSSEIYNTNIWSEIERYCFIVRHLADSHEVDLIHAHDWMTFPAAFEFQRVTGVPVFLHVHATEYDRSGDNLNHEVFRIEREGFRRATHIFAVSHYTAGIIERLYGVSRKKISVIYNAPEETRSPFTPPETDRRKPQVVFLGRLTYQKGPDHFLKAAALVSQANPEARFVFCGTGDMMDKLRDQTYRLQLEDKIHFAGFVEPSGVDEILSHSRVLVMPSVSEPFGLVALEAIRCGIPVIISKQSGVREVLHRALQVDFWDHEKLADQILAALRLQGLSQQLVQDGMDQVKMLSWDKSARQVVDAYKRILGSTYAQAVGGTHGH